MHALCHVLQHPGGILGVEPWSPSSRSDGAVAPWRLSPQTIHRLGKSTAVTAKSQSEGPDSFPFDRLSLVVEMHRMPLVHDRQTDNKEGSRYRKALHAGKGTWCLA
jgi:hypothetical protein